MFLVTAGTIIFFMSILIWGATYFPRSEEANARYAKDYQTRFAPLPEESRPSEENYIAERQMEDSYLGRVGRTIEPVFIPAGFDWRITTAILAAFPAREVVVSAMGITFRVGSDVDEESVPLKEAIKRATWPDGRKLMTPWTAVGLMVFFALCAQCMATLAAVKRETNSTKWAVFMFVYMTALAYLGAVFVNQLSKWFG